MTLILTYAKLLHGVLLGLICKYKNGKITQWHKKWDYDNAINKFYVTYQEKESNEQAYNKGFVNNFKNNFEYFKNSIKEIEELSKILELQEWKEHFRKIFDLENISNAKKYPATEGLHNVMSEKNLCIYAMAMDAFVFGGMGSWNDGPLNIAITRGMETDFVRKSQILFAELMVMLSYATNNIID